MRARTALIVVVMAACGGSSGGGADAPVADAAGTPDAAIDAAVADAAPPDATPTCHVLFLDFDGETLHPGFDDARSNTSSILNATVTIAAFRAGDASRADVIAAFSAQVQAALAPFGVAVTTSRPTSGGYDLILIGGDGTELGGQPLTAIAPATCSVITNAVGYVFDTTDSGDVEKANLAVAVYGVVNGVPTSTDGGDCMCFGSGSCITETTACTIGGAGTTRDPSGQCGAGTTFDEAAAFTAALGCP